jgi:hypothetical protein
MIDWALWGVVAAVAIGAPTIGIPFWIDRRGNTFAIDVSGSFDKSGVVLVRIKKTGRPAVHIEDVKLLRPDTNSVLPLLWRTTVGPFDIAAGDAEYKCYFQLPKPEIPSESDVVDVYVRWAEQTRKEKAKWTAQNLVLPSGFTPIDVKDPDPGRQAGSSNGGKHEKKDAEDGQ